MQRVLKRINLDRIGSVASFLCVIHCVLTGFFLSVLPMIGAQFINSTGAEIAFFGAAGGIGTFAIIRGYRRHRSLVPAAFFVVGLGTVVVAHVVFRQTGSVEAIWSIIGGALLITFHVLNARTPTYCGCDICEARKSE